MWVCELVVSLVSENIPLRNVVLCEMKAIGEEIYHQQLQNDVQNVGTVNYIVVAFWHQPEDPSYGQVGYQE